MLAFGVHRETTVRINEKLNWKLPNVIKTAQYLNLENQRRIDKFF